MDKIMSKAMKGVCLAGGIYATARFFWAIGCWYGTGAGVATCCDIELGKVEGVNSAMDYVKYIDENEKNLFGALFMGGAMDLVKYISKENK